MADDDKDLHEQTQAALRTIARHERQQALAARGRGLYRETLPPVMLRRRGGTDLPFPIIAKKDQE